VVILALGEDSYQTGEARSQVNIRLSGVQMDLFKEINKVNNNIIIVLMNGRPLEITELAENASTIVEAWHLGSEAGNSIADVLFGKYNPSGKLPVCFPRHVGQIPLYYSQKATGRGKQGQDVFWSHYTDESNDPLFPFGFGLSYTSFGYSDIKLSSNTLEKNLTISASISLINKGKVAGEEVVQLYIQDMVGSTTRPIKELKGFQKIFLQPGESKKVEFIIDSEMLSFYTINEKWEAEPGRFKAFIGTNSIDTKQIDFELLGEG
jgi:beta-glucosidase